MHEEPHHRRLLILVVDDNHDGAVMLSTLLELKGHQTNTVHNGLDAVRAATLAHYDAVLLDLGMPIMDGFEAAAALGQLRPAPVLIACSAWETAKPLGLTMGTWHNRGRLRRPGRGLKRLRKSKWQGIHLIGGPRHATPQNAFSNVQALGVGSIPWWTPSRCRLDGQTQEGDGRTLTLPGGRIGVHGNVNSAAVGLFLASGIRLCRRPTLTSKRYRRPTGAAPGPLFERRRCLRAVPV